MTNAAIAIEEFASVAKNTLVGFVRVRLPSGMILHDVAIHQKDGNAWASPPSKPMVGRDGSQIRGNDGKPRWSPIVEFASRELRDKFSTAVLDALRVSRPGILG